MAKQIGLDGPYTLDSGTISRLVSESSTIAYVLGYLGSDGLFYVNYAGRSDYDGAGRLRAHIGEDRQFMFGYYASYEAAFHKECLLYHDFSPPRNKIHPDRPTGTQYRCPVLTCPV